MTNYKLGKKAPRYDARTMNLINYVSKRALVAPPTHASWFNKIGSNAWGMMLNDSLGDCVCAAYGHMVKQWTTYAGASLTPSDSSVLTMYEQVGGYVPGDPTTDNGCDMLTACNWCKSTGMLVNGAAHKIGAFAYLDPTKPTLVKNAVALLGNVYLGIALPLSAQGQISWQVPSGGAVGNGAPGSWGGHCVPIVSYDPTGLIVITWGAKLFMSWEFLATYADEAYAMCSPDWIKANGISPSNFDITALLADVAQL